MPMSGVTSGSTGRPSMRIQSGSTNQAMAATPGSPSSQSTVKMRQLSRGSAGAA